MLSAAIRPAPTTVAPAWTKPRRLVQRHALVPALVFPTARDAAPMRDWHAAGVKREATIARLDVLEAAVLPPSDSLPRPERVPAAHHLADPGAACCRSLSGADAVLRAGGAVPLTARKCGYAKHSASALADGARYATVRASSGTWGTARAPQDCPETHLG